MGKACLNKEVGTYECEGERDTYSFLPLSQIYKIQVVTRNNAG